jgi:hypothetical protein
MKEFSGLAERFSAPQKKNCAHRVRRKWKKLNTSLQRNLNTLVQLVTDQRILPSGCTYSVHPNKPFNLTTFGRFLMGWCGMKINRSYRYLTMLQHYRSCLSWILCEEVSRAKRLWPTYGSCTNLFYCWSDHGDKMKEFEGVGHKLFYVYMPAFSWKCYEKPVRMTVKLSQICS